MSEFPLYALSNSDLLALPQWQRAIDELDLLFDVRLQSIEVGAGKSCAMQFAHVPTRFTCERALPDALLSGRHASFQGRWSHAYAFNDLGRHAEVTAAAVACLSYLIVTGGAFFRIGGEVELDLRWARRELDSELAYDLRQEDAYFDRYPQERRPEPTGPTELEIILHPGQQE